MLKIVALMAALAIPVSALAQIPEDPMAAWLRDQAARDAETPREQAEQSAQNQAQADSLHSQFEAEETQRQLQALREQREATSTERKFVDTTPIDPQIDQKLLKSLQDATGSPGGPDMVLTEHQEDGVPQVVLTSMRDDIVIDQVTANHGNCLPEISRTESPLGAWQFPGRLKYGQQLIMSFYQCAPIEVRVQRATGYGGDSIFTLR